MLSKTFPALGRVSATLGLLFGLQSALAPACAQQVQTASLIAAAEPLATPELPDSPGVSSSASSADSAPFRFAPDAQTGSGVAQQIAPKYRRVIQANQAALPLTSGDKMVLSLRGRISPVAIASTLVSVGISHGYDSRPHYGTDSAGFGERLGATELRQTSQAFLSYGLIASILHDDPRYYVLGPKYSPKHRAIYAAERILITRKDNGRSAINFPQLIGIASSQAIANSYYPERDQSVRRTITGTVSSYGTTALVNEVNEFLGDVIHHFRRKPQP